MKLIIDIPDTEYETCRKYHQKDYYGSFESIALTAIANGIPFKECEDCVSRQAAIDAIDKWVKSMHVLIALPANEVTPLFESVRELPPVNTAEKVGHWIKIDDCSNSGYYCSECHKRVVKEGWSDTVKIIKYCPNCGVKMQKVEE